MNAVQVKFKVDRAAAIMAGRTEFGDTILAIDPAKLPEDLRDELAHHVMVHAMRDDVTVHLLHTASFQDTASEATEAAVADLLRRHRERRIAADAARAEQLADRSREYAVAVDYWLALSDDDRVKRDPSDRMRVGRSCFGDFFGVKRPPEAPYQVTKDPRVGPEFDRLLVLAAARNAVLSEEIEAAESRRAAEQKAVDERKAATLAAWAADETLLTETQRKRRAAGLMPDDELLAAVRDMVFAPLSGLPRYERMTADDVRQHAEVDYYAEVTFKSRDATTCTDDEFEAAEAVKQLMADAGRLAAEVRIREHVGSIDGDTDAVDMVRRSILVTVDADPAGDYRVSREFAL